MVVIRATIERPFVAGIVADLPAHKIGAQNSVSATDGHSPEGIFKKRHGWTYDGDSQVVSGVGLYGIDRTRFVLADADVTTASDKNGRIYIHNSTGAGTKIYEPATVGEPVWIPRCVYRDELIYCAGDGHHGIARYAGASVAYQAAAIAGSWKAGKSTFDSTTTPFSTASVGAFLTGFYGDTVVPDWPSLSYKILESTATDVVTLEGARSSSGVDRSMPSVFYEPYGSAYPAVAIYGAGTVTSVGGVGATVTGTGVRWISGDWGVLVAASGTALPRWDAALIMPVGASAFHVDVGTVADTTFVANVSAFTDAPYFITRRLPFTDAASHKGSFWGTGVAQYPTRVYVGPPGWNLSFPPGFELPFDPDSESSSSNSNDFLMDFVSVPSDTDDDPVVAILSSPGPLLVLKEKAAYQINGVYGSLDVSLLAGGFGCLDLRAAKSYAQGQFWCGPDDIYWYRNGGLIELTKDKIRSAWRAFTRDFDRDFGASFCSLTIDGDYLCVFGFSNATSATFRRYMDLRDLTWQAEMSGSNAHIGQAITNSRVPSERDKTLMGVALATSRVADLSPVFNGLGDTDQDADGNLIELSATTSSSFGRDIDGLSRIIDLDVHLKYQDASLPQDSGEVVVSVLSTGGIENEAETTKTLTAIEPSSASDIKRHHFKVNRLGRFHQVQITEGETGVASATAALEVHQITATFRDSRSRA